MGAAGSKRFKSEFVNDEVVPFDGGGGGGDEKGMEAAPLPPFPSQSIMSSQIYPVGEKISAGVHSHQRQQDMSVSELSITEFADEKTPPSRKCEHSSSVMMEVHDDISESIEELSCIIEPPKQPTSSAKLNHSEPTSIAPEQSDSEYQSYHPKHSPILSSKASSSGPNDLLVRPPPSPSPVRSKESTAGTPSLTESHKTMEIILSSQEFKSQTPMTWDDRDAAVASSPEDRGLLLLTESPSFAGDKPTESVTTPKGAQQEFDHDYLRPFRLQPTDSNLRSLDSPERPLLSPLVSDTDEDSLSLAGYGSIMQKVQMENQSLLELQRRRTMSTMNNAKVRVYMGVLHMQAA